MSSDGVQMEEHEHLQMTNKYSVEQSTSKWSQLSRKSFAVGSLARLNNNFDKLHSSARALSESFGLAPVNQIPT